MKIGKENRCEKDAADLGVHPSWLAATACSSPPPCGPGASSRSPLSVPSQTRTETNRVKQNNRTGYLKTEEWEDQSDGPKGRKGRRRSGRRRWRGHKRPTRRCSQRGCIRRRWRPSPPPLPRKLRRAPRAPAASRRQAGSSYTFFWRWKQALARVQGLVRSRTAGWLAQPRYYSTTTLEPAQAQNDLVLTSALAQYPPMGRTNVAGRHGGHAGNRVLDTGRL